jgi:hypothetical protein
MEKRSRFTRPETTTLPLANGDTLTVKRRLTAGEQRAMFSRMYQTGAEGLLQLDRMQLGLATMLAYLVDWTLTDDNGQLVEIRGLPPEDLAVILDSLTPEDFKEISTAIDAHSEAMEAFRAAEKKTASGGAGSPSTSPSPADLVGATSGSAT